jgi:hypothetical protein
MKRNVRDDDDDELQFTRDLVLSMPSGCFRISYLSGRAVSVARAILILCLFPFGMDSLITVWEDPTVGSQTLSLEHCFWTNQCGMLLCFQRTRMIWYRVSVKSNGARKAETTTQRMGHSKLPTFTGSVVLRRSLGSFFEILGRRYATADIQRRDPMPGEVS